MIFSPKSPFSYLSKILSSSVSQTLHLLLVINPPKHREPESTMATRGLKICLGVSALFLIIATTVIVTLIFTVFKLKDPEILVHPIGLENISLSPGLALNVSLSTLITIVNPNYGGFRYINSTGYVNYDGNVVAEIPLVTNFVPARSKINVNTAADFMVQKLINDPKFWVDVASGTLNLTSSATMPGKASILKAIKLKAMAYSWCNFSFNIISKHVDSKCVSKIKLWLFRSQESQNVWRYK